MSDGPKPEDYEDLGEFVGAVARHALDDPAAERNRLRAAMVPMLGAFKALEQYLLAVRSGAAPADAAMAVIAAGVDMMHKAVEAGASTFDPNAAEYQSAVSQLFDVADERDRLRAAAQTLIAVIEAARPGTDVFRLSGSDPVYRLKAALDVSGNIGGGDE